MNIISHFQPSTQANNILQETLEKFGGPELRSIHTMLIEMFQTSPPEVHQL